MGGHIEVDHLPSVVQQHHEARQHIESHSGHREEVNRYNLAGMIGQKTLPVLRRWLATADSIFRNC